MWSANWNVKIENFHKISENKKSKYKFVIPVQYVKNVSFLLGAHLSTKCLDVNFCDDSVSAVHHWAYVCYPQFV
jgi:hypothetical protein